MDAARTNDGDGLLFPATGTGSFSASEKVPVPFAASERGTGTFSQSGKGASPYEVLRELGDCYTSLGKYPQAQQCYEKAASLGPDEPGPYIGLGVAALQTDKLDDAEIAFRVAYRLDPKCAKACAGLALVAQQRRDLAQAFDYYMKSLELDADNIMALLGLFQVSCAMGSFAKVTGYLEAYLRTRPGDASVMFALAVLYMKDGRLRRSKAMLEELLLLDPAHRDAANLLEEVEHTLRI